MNLKNQDYKRDSTCCFTGPRPKNLPWGYNEHCLTFLKFKKLLRKNIINAIKSGKNYFISGMALGIDLLAAKLILELKRRYKYLKLECAVPCYNQTKNWTDIIKIEEYKEILQKADVITFCSQSNYFDGCMEIRNRYMIDKSSLLIAVYGGKKGGTYQTINIAKEKNIDVIIIDI